MSYTIREATQPDIAAIRELLVETWHATYDSILGADKVSEITERWHSSEALLRQLQTASANPHQDIFLVAENGGMIHATALASMAGSTITLQRLYVRPNLQRNGIGKALFNDVLTRFSQASNLKLEVEPGNVQAIAFYRRLGLRIEPTDKTCGGDSDDALSHNLMSATLPLKTIRPVRDSDAQDLFGLITLCFADYPGCFVDPHDDLPDLLAPGTALANRNGAFWVIEDQRGRVAACCAIDFPEDGVAEVHRLYVRPDMRRGGLAQRLMQRCEAFARERGASRIVLWSDTRFDTAHLFYEKRGYRRGAEPRKLNDISHSLEYFFEKELN